MVVVVLVISVLNLCLGFALAVHLGFGPPGLCQSWAAILGVAHGGRSRENQRRVEDSVDIPADEESGGDGGYPEPESGSPADPSPPESDRDHFAILCRSVAEIDTRLNDLTKLLEDQDRWPLGKTAWSFVVELQEICQPYLRHLEAAMNHLCREPDAADDGQLNADVEQLILEQVAQVETTLNNLQYMDFNSGLDAALERLTTEAANTSSSATRLNKTLQSMFGETERQDT